MERVIELVVPLKVDIGIGKNWSEAHPWTEGCKRVLSPSSPDVLALREAQASRAALRLGSRSAPPA